MKALIAALSAVLLVGCGHAVFITRTPNAGTLKLKGWKGPALTDAQQKIAEVCGGQKFTESRSGRLVTYECARGPATH